MKIIYIQNKLRPLGQGEEQKNLIFESVKHTKCALICYKKHRCWRCWLISAMGAKTHQARTITSKLFILHCNGCDFWLDQNVTNCLRRWLFRWLGQLDSLETLVRTMKNDQWKWKMKKMKMKNGQLDSLATLVRIMKHAFSLILLLSQPRPTNTCISY